MKLSGLTRCAVENQLYDLIARRMLAAFYPFHEYDSTKVITAVPGNAREHFFRTNGKVVIVNGWRDVAELGDPPKPKSTGRGKKKSADTEEVALPPLHPGDTRVVAGAEVKEDKTKPPAQHNDASLLAASPAPSRICAPWR